MHLKVHTLSIRYILTFSLLVILPVLLYTFVSSLNYSRYQRDLSRLQLQQNVNQMAENLNDEIASALILSSALIHNENFREVCDLYDAATAPRDIYLQSEAMDLELSNLFLYTSKRGIIHVYTRNRPVFLFRNFPMSRNLPNGPLPEQAMQKEVEMTPGAMQVSDDFFILYQNIQPRDAKEPMLTLGIQPRVRGVGTSINKIIFSFKIQIFERIYNNSSRHQFNYITDSSGNILLSPESENGLDLMTGDEREESGWLILKSPISNTGWTLYHVTDFQALLEPFYKIQRFSLLIFGILFIFFIAYTVLFFHSMISPLNDLIEKMQLVEGGDYSVSVPEPAQRELNNLFHSFNRMISRVNELTETQSKIDREKGLLELQALQYQINPHFIANTLNSIRLMAVVKKNENIKNMTASLMKIINDSFRGEGNKTSLRDEKKALESYAHIMKVRFSTPIELRFSIPGELEEARILKMVLQPIVENSIVHGFARKKGKGIILIKAEIRREQLYLIVCDNGEGFKMNRGELPDKPESSSAGTLTRVGIRNVDRRIRLNYGESCGLEMDSRPGYFTKTGILLPLLKESESDLHNDS